MSGPSDDTIAEIRPQRDRNCEPIAGVQHIEKTAPYAGTRVTESMPNDNRNAARTRYCFDTLTKFTPTVSPAEAFTPAGEPP